MRPSVRRGIVASVLLVALAVPGPAFAAEPSAVPQSVETTPSTPVTILLSGTDADVDTLTFEISTGPTNGTLGAIDTPACDAGTCTANVEYTPTGAFRGTDSFAFTVADGTTTSGPATVSIVVDTAPVAVADPDGGCSAHPNGTYETNEDSLLSVSGLPCRLLANDTDAETDALTAVLGTPGTGTPVVDSDGSFTYMPAPNANSTGAASEVTDSFTYVADDGLLTSAPATVSVHVWPVNDPPTFEPGSLTIQGDEDTAYDADWASAMSAGPADESAQILTFTVVATDPTLFEVGPAVDASTGRLSFTPAANANGTTDLAITLGDDGGTDRGGDATSAEATVSVTINPSNDAPIAVDDTASVGEDAGSATIDVLDDDTDVDLDTLTVVSVTQPTNGVAASTGTDVTYTPNAGYNGPDSFDYTISDGLLEDTATVSITVTPVNDAPSFTMGSATSVNEDSGAASIPGWVTAMSPGPLDEAGQVLTLAVTGNSAPGLFAVQPALSPTGTLTFTPKANAKGTATITVTLSDDGGTAGGGVDATSATFGLTIASVNDAPTFTLAGDQAVLEDSGPAAIASFVSAMSPGPVESFQTLTLSVPLVTNPGLFLAGPVIDQGSGQLSFTPAANAFGTSTVTVRLKDSGGTSNGGIDTTEKTFKITVTAVNDAPSVTPGVDPSVVEDAGAQTFTDWATFSPGPANESAQTVTAYTITSNSNAALFAVAPAVSTSGTLTFTSAPDANGSATLGLRVRDSGSTANGGVRNSAIVSFTITVSALNDAPTAIPGASPTVAEDAGAQSLAAWAAFSSGPPDEGSQTVVAYAIVSNSNPSLFGVAPAVAPDGTLTFTPGANRNGSATLGLRVTDSGGTANGGVATSPVATFTITVTPVNDAPNAVNDTSFSVAESGPAVDLDVLANDTTIDGAEALTVTLVSDPAHGTATVTAAGTGVTYKPDPGYVGTDLFTYTISDPGLLTDTATVLLTVVADETAPTATKPVQRIRASTTLGLTTVPARITWTMADGGSGVASVQLQRSIDGGAYANVTLSGPLAVRFDTALATGHTYRFRVRAVDAVGNVGAWTYGTAFLVARDEDTSPTITYAGTWAAAARANASGGSTMYATTAGATATWTGTARDVAIAAPRSSTRGSIRIYVDDVLVATVSLSNATTQDRRIVWQRHFSALAAHVIRIEVVGDGRVDLDAIAVLR